MKELNEGYVINIQHYSVHDGPGIRTLVFLKGCPLKCRWCSNPESQKNNPELAYNSDKCIGINQCGKCIDVCKYKAIKKFDGKILIDRGHCIQCHKCQDVCPSKSLSVYGKRMTIDEILNIVEKDRMFYSRSGGGLTISGGEPFNQPNFTICLLKMAKERRINTAVETCGYTKWQYLRHGSEFLDTIIFDIKCIDSEKHRKYTGVDNKLILDNFNKLCEVFPEKLKLIRTPIVPEFNDSIEDITEIVDFIKNKPNVEYELLPYHRLGQPKYTYIGKQYIMGEIKLNEEKFKRLEAINTIADKRRSV
ncbi:glycyl-radical enzyme activating protein [Clostridium tyrobutyricum]|uniref:(2S)-3-sulfopropanediol dehydratase activating enzyme n=1 Tax=Clostridium tyrobutyricum TaxID=1519 RepID=UPI001C388CF4|nr:glycyl-radical enzyme activating protein [Clostridium tyrobutyricum]MBV4419442.1 glycyl-radical enzyme activating protein [Clostridium tyrobutyricum]